MRVLVTGNMGYIGPVLTNRLVLAGHSVRGLDSGLFCDYALGPIAVPDQHLADIRDLSAVSRAVDGCDAVIHLAGMSNDPMGELDPEITRSVNLEASLSLIALAGDRPLVFYSSASVYGYNNELCDESSPTNPLTLYAKTKLAVEEALAGRPKTLILRNGTVHGPAPNFRGDLLLNTMVLAALTTGEVVLTTSPETMRPVVDVRDLADLTVLLLGGGAEGTYNVASANVSVGEAAKLVSEITNTHIVESYSNADPRSYSVFCDPPVWWSRRDLADSIDDIVAFCRRFHITAADVANRRFHRLQQYLWTTKHE